MGNLRKFFFVVLVLAFTVFSFAADRVKIFYSPLGGYSMLRGDYIISYFDDDGTLDTWQVEKMAEYIGRYAGNVREFSFWIDSEDSLQKLRPFNVVSGSIEVLDSFERNWKEIITTYNKNGVKVWISLFDHCGIRKNPSNPWAAFGESYFYGENAREARHKYIDAFLRIDKDRVMGYELVNEPRLNLCTPEFLADTFIYLIRKDVPAHDIILGVEYPLKEKDPRYAELYRKFRNIVMKELGQEWGQWFKDRCISPCHGMNLINLKEMLGENPPPGGTRNLLISKDGVRKPRPTKSKVKTIVKCLFDLKYKAAWAGKLSVEVVYGKKRTDPLDSIMGVVEAVREFFGEYPENYRKYLEKVQFLEELRLIFSFLTVYFWR
jgi:hypothetical protein